MTAPVIPIKALQMFKMALALGFRVDVATGRAFRPDGSVWKAGANTNGYLHLQGSAAIFGSHFTIPVHKAVAYLKYGDSAFGGVSVHARHLDGNKLNNCGENIILGTPSQNALDKPIEVRRSAGVLRAKRLGQSRLSEISAKGKSKVDWVAVGRKSAAASGKKKLCPQQVAAIRANAELPSATRKKQRQLAAELCVSQGTICDILAGRCYADVGRTEGQP